jgi:hypothetical protein
MLHLKVVIDNRNAIKEEDRLLTYNFSNENIIVVLNWLNDLDKEIKEKILEVHLYHED